jgi:hypothetical protein
VTDRRDEVEDEVTRRPLNWWWWLSAPALVIALSSWCQLHGRALGLEPLGFGVSMPWALRSAFGWVLIGGLFAHFGDRVLTSRFANHHQWCARVLMTLTIPLVTLGSEVVLLSGETPTGLWLYNRLPLHLPSGALLFIGFLWIRARHQRSVERDSAPAASPEAAAAIHHPSPLTVDVMTGTGRTTVSLEEIECLEADRNYINVHTPQRSYLLRQTLTSLEKTLRPDTFLRIHRSIIVNRSKIRERRRGGVLVLHSGRVVRVSRAFAARVNRSE